MNKPVKLVGVIGPNKDLCPPPLYAFAESLGKNLLDAGYWIVCGGKGGVMEAVCKGGRQSPQFQKGACIGIIPESDPQKANPYCDLVIATGLGEMRNLVLVNTAQVLIALGGGAGTLSELALAWKQNKRVICYQGSPGWAAQLAGSSLDNRKREAFLAAHSIEDIMLALQS